jgi:aryl-alcohol dehydrogenase-like predicted oxidoreductase
MEYRRLGGSGVKVSEISLGSWLTYGGSVAEQQATACIHRAYDLGINFFDTANVYVRGAAEEIVGNALKGFKRDSYFLATKVYFPMGVGPNDRGLSRKHIMEQCHASLKRLGVDYVDLYQCHRYDEGTPLEETLRALDDLVRQGKVLYVGVSEWTADQIADALRLAKEMNLDRIVSNQPRYNMIQRQIEAEVVPLSEREGVGQVVFSPLAQGVLTGKYRPGEAPEGGTRAADPESSRFMRQLMNEEGPLRGRRAARRGLRRGPHHVRARTRLGAAPAERQQRHHRGVEARAGRGQRGGLGGAAAAGRAGPDRRDPRRRDTARLGASHTQLPLPGAML